MRGKNAAQVTPYVPLLPYQRADVESEARFRWCCWSRQSGKSFSKSLRRVLRGLRRRRTQIFLSAGERQSRELMDKARRHCQALQVAAQMTDSDFFAGTSFRKLEIHLPNQVRIIGLPANPQTARGYTGDVLLDEFAMHRDDRAVWAALFPSLLRGQGELDIASTPKGCRNLFADLRHSEQFERSTLTLPQAIDQGLDGNVEEIRRAMNDEELFRQEFLCEFLDEATALLTHEQITACQDAALAKELIVESSASRRGDLFVGVDIGRRRDLTVIWVLQRDGAQLVTRGVVELALAPFRRQWAALRGVLALRGVRRCCIDAGGLGMQLAETAVEEFGGHRVEPITFTNALKSQLANGLRIAVEEGRIRIPVDDAIRNDWHSLERSVTVGGHVRLDAARAGGSHADRFWAAALAVHAAGDAPEVADYHALGRSSFARAGTW